MLKKQIILFAATVSLSLSSSVSAHEQKYTIGLAVANLQADFFNFIKESAEEEGERLGYDIITVDAGGDSAKQVSQIQDLIWRKVDALIYIPAGATASDVPVRAAKNAGIPVVNVDRNTQNPPGDTFIATDSEEAARILGEYVAKITGGKGVVGVVQGQLGTTPEIARDTGFEKALAGYPNLNTVEKQASKGW
ncbi:MAG: substrate-binding domain-containing protein, partial [Gammaproteobacteria bacterium]